MLPNFAGSGGVASPLVQGAAATTGEEGGDGDGDDDPAAAGDGAGLDMSFCALSHVIPSHLHHVSSHLHHVVKFWKLRFASHTSRTRAPTHSNCALSSLRHKQLTFPLIPLAGEEFSKMAPSTVLKNAEDKDEVLHEVKSKLTRFDPEQTDSNDKWRDLGKGERIVSDTQCNDSHNVFLTPWCFLVRPVCLRVTRAADTGKERVVMRNDLGKVVLNFYFTKGMKFTENKPRNSMTFVAPNPNGQLQMFGIRVSKENYESTLRALNCGVNS